MNSAVLKYPYPNKAWLAMANDPDNTVIEDWQELHSFIWDELKLPFGDSLFVKSFNQNLPTQVNLEGNPEIGTAHLHDIIHTWGDYMHGRKRGFDREDALEAAATLKNLGIKPKVWIDHASFVGNMIHGTNKGALDKLTDSSGHVYQNFVYSLGIARNLGIRYIWNGEVSNIVGQDRKLVFADYRLQSGGNRLKASAKSVLHQMPSIRTGYVAPDNRQYNRKKFADGSELYCFRRYGTWQDADIDGLHNLINPTKIDELIKQSGTAIVYSHLGKRYSKDSGRKNHIPETTREDFKNVKQKFEAGELMVSSTSDLLDYLVLRDRIEVDVVASEIRINPDGISFEKLTSESLSGKTFSFHSKGINLNKLKVIVDGNVADIKPTIHSNEVFSLAF